MRDDARLERERQAAFLTAMDRAGSDRPDRLQIMIGRVFAETSVPTSVPRYFAVHPVIPDGAEVEGGAASNTIHSNSTAYVLVLGPRVPVAGDDLVCYQIGDRWVAEFHKARAVLPTLPCQPCAIPQKDLDVTYIYTPVGGGSQISSNLTFVYRNPPGPFPVPTGSHWWEIPRQAFPTDSPLHSTSCPTVSARMYCAGAGATAGMSLTTHTDDPFGSCFGAASNASGSPGFFNCDDFFLTFLFSGFGIGRFVVSDPG